MERTRQSDGMQRRQNCRGGGWTYKDEAYKDKVDVNEEAYETRRRMEETYDEEEEEDIK